MARVTSSFPAPYLVEGFEGGDGLQNLTESLFGARVLDPGIYVVIHNQVFPVDRVRKDQQQARFVCTEG